MVVTILVGTWVGGDEDVGVDDETLPLLLLLALLLALELALDEAEVEFPPPVWKEGGGTAFDVSTSFPIPQGILAPSGCVSSGGGTVFPPLSAIANRVAHWNPPALGAEYWKKYIAEKGSTSGQSNSNLPSLLPSSPVATVVK